MKYNKRKFLKYIQGDMFLKFTWEQYKNALPAEQHDSQLQAMFNTYVLGNSVAEREYAVT